MKKTTVILKTKLYCPQETVGFVMRERLLDVLNASFTRPLTLVSAPAGYGKSVVVSEWTRSLPEPAAWLVLDAAESELSQFLAYLQAALDSVYPGVFESFHSWLISPNLPAPQTIANALINEIVDIASPVILVLDDYHQIDHGSAVHELVAAILKHPPDNFHLVLVTRRDPPLALAKLKANNQLTELRLADLRFSETEATQLLATALGEVPASSQVRDLQAAVEGWAAGLRMVALAASHLQNPDLTLQAAPAGLQQIQEYLLQEVVEGLPPATQYMLLCSAIPEKFCAGLLDNIAELMPGDGEMDGSDFIHRAEQNNMFLIALDASGTWYRYHHLFRDLLLQQLQSRVSPQEQASIQSRIAMGLEELGLLEYAIRIYIDAGRSAEAAQVVDRHRVSALDEDQWLQVSRWLQLFSPSEVSNWPGTLLARAWVGHFNIDLDLIADLVPQLEIIQSKHGLTDSQCGELDYSRAVLLYWSGDIAAASTMFERADEAPLGHGTIKGQLQIYLAMCRTMQGDSELALQGIAALKALDAGKRGTLASRLVAAEFYTHYFGIATVPAAKAAARLAMISSSDFDSKHARAWANYMQGLVLFSTGRFSKAESAFDRASEGIGHIEYQARMDMLAGKILCFAYLQEWEKLEAELLRLESLALAPQMDEARAQFLASVRARSALLHADVETAIELAQELPELPAVGTLMFWLEEPAITRIRVDLARGERAFASSALKAISAIRVGTVAQHLLCQDIDLMLLEAVAREQLAEPAKAQALLEEALALAAPANWSRPFQELGDALKPLLEQLVACPESRDFLEMQCGLRLTGQALADETETGNAPIVAGELSEAQFTNRERDILELLAQRFRNKEIASQLFISTHTVNYHLKHIYQKLDVSGRRMAVSRAIELGILSA